MAEVEPQNATVTETQGNPYEADLNTALFLLEICSHLTRKCQSLDSKTKIDGSPVTHADLAVQSIVTLYLGGGSADFVLVGEENEKCVEGQEGSALLENVTKLVNEYFPFEKLEDRIVFTPSEVLQSLRQGNGNPAQANTCWIIDPIDGTRGFLHNGQYALALGKLVEGELVISVVSCPNIPSGTYCEMCVQNHEEMYMGPPNTDEAQKDCWMVAAAKGQGCRQIRFPWGSKSTTWDRMSPCSVSSRSSMFDFRFCESINYPPPEQKRAAQLAMANQSTQCTYRLDGMAKYALVATGQMEAYLRFSAANKQKCWDHVGELLVREAGGEVSDVDGIHLNFTRGRILELNKQLVASNKTCHDDLLEVSRTALGL